MQFLGIMILVKVRLRYTRFWDLLCVCLLDHGLEVLSQWVAQSNFPWLMSNVVDNETGRPLGEGKITSVVNWNGRRIGLLGLVEKEWLDTIATINPDEVTFFDFVEAGQKLGGQLKQEVSLKKYKFDNTRMKINNGYLHLRDITQICDVIFIYF